MKKPFKNTFIHQQKINTKVCKDILEYFNNNDQKIIEGRVVGGVIKEIKDSRDLSIAPTLNEYPFNEYKKDDPKYRIMQLFHGTKVDCIYDITHNGFDYKKPFTAYLINLNLTL
jgi:uncharacterized protein YpiB (UPF0302 family)